MAIAGVVVLIFWGFARSFVTSNLRHEAEADVESSLVEQVAESAVAEAEAQVGWQVNALETQLAQILRKPVLAGDNGDFDLTPYVQLTQTEALLQTPAFKGYTISSFNARVVFQRQLDCVPNEKRALFAFSATVTSPGLVRKVSRKLELGRWGKITLTTVPRPFGTFGLFLLNSTGLTDAATVNRCRDRAIALCRELREKIKTASAGGPSAQAATDLLATAFDPDGTSPAPDPFVLPDGAVFYGLAESRAPQKLKSLDLGARMSELIEKAERASAELTARSGSASADPSGFSETSRNALGAAIAPLTELWTYQRNYTMMQPGSGPEWNDLNGVLFKLREDYFRRRAHYRLEESPGHTDLSAELKDLLDHQASGVIDVANQTTPITVSGSVPGRVVLIVGPGGARLRSVNASEASTGQVTVVCGTGPLSISGQNGVSLVLVDPPDGRGSCQLTFEGDARVRGSLIATTVPPGNWTGGELERDDRVYSGFTEPSGVELGLNDRLFVGLSPRTYFRRVVAP